MDLAGPIENRHFSLKTVVESVEELKMMDWRLNRLAFGQVALDCDPKAKKQAWNEHLSRLVLVAANTLAAEQCQRPLFCPGDW